MRVWTCACNEYCTRVGANGTVDFIKTPINQVYGPCFVVSHPRHAWNLKYGPCFVVSHPRHAWNLKSLCSLLPDGPGTTTCKCKRGQALLPTTLCHHLLTRRVASWGNTANTNHLPPTNRAPAFFFTQLTQHPAAPMFMSHRACSSLCPPAQWPTHSCEAVASSHKLPGHRRSTSTSRSTATSTSTSTSRSMAMANGC